VSRRRGGQKAHGSRSQQKSVAPPVRTRRQSNPSGNGTKQKQKPDEASVPAGWATGKLDDGTPFWFHAHNAQHIVFSLPDAAAPQPRTPKKKKKQRKQKRDAKSSKTKQGSTSTTVRSPGGSSAEADEEARQVLLCYFMKYRPEDATEEKVEEAITAFQLERKFRRDWCEVMFTDLKGQSGEDPRDVFADAQAARARSEEEEEDLGLLQSAAAGRFHPTVEMEGGAMSPPAEK
jgi:hypothetical protein